MGSQTQGYADYRHGRGRQVERSSSVLFHQPVQQTRRSVRHCHLRDRLPQEAHHARREGKPKRLQGNLLACGAKVYPDARREQRRCRRCVHCQRRHGPGDHRGDHRRL